VLRLNVSARNPAMPGRRLAIAAILAATALFASAPNSAIAVPGGAGQISEVAPTGGTPFDRQGMWIWYVSRSDGGDVSRMIERANRYGVGTLYIKAGDAGSTWSQFNTPLIEALHQGGLDVCAWQFVYGDRPVAEAKVGAAAVRRGADCLVIDAEGHYEGKYAAADRYIRALRARIGESFPLSLAAFPYVDYHPSFPYSVFFGPGGATYNQPQMYWKTIGTSVRAVYEHTYLFNRIWDVPLYPLGQTYSAPGRKPVMRFRRFAESYGGLAPSWWSWQETTPGLWRALGALSPEPVFGYRPIVSHPTLKRGSKGDLVVWAQSHLVAAGQSVPITGIFGKLTRSAVRNFQTSRGLFADGVLGTETWEALLSLDPVRPGWGARPTLRRRSARISAAAVSPSRPLSASLPAKDYEINPGSAP
jgi:putative peptidoglycan binding protein